MKDNHKHAYLIIAHNEFEVLQTLLNLIDDVRNDIYIHFDKKVKILPKLTCYFSKLEVLSKRVDVRWGHVSQIESEYALFETALNSGKIYDRYHLISGTHLPLKTQNEIHNFFMANTYREVLNYLPTSKYEIDLKLRHYHFFLRTHKHHNRNIRYLTQKFWHVLLKIQDIFSIKRSWKGEFHKANNWVSLTHNGLSYVLEKKEEVLQKFKWTFCGDEFFIPYLLDNEPKKFIILNCDKILFSKFEKESPAILKITDYDTLIKSSYLFARKFSSTEIELVEHIKNYLLSSKI